MSVFSDDTIVPEDGSRNYVDDISLVDVSGTGTYYCYVVAVPCYSNGEPVEGWSDWDDVPSVSVPFKVALLKAPTSLKLSTGKKKVTISYKKATGANKYEIYRSTKKSSGYSKIATTSSTKYTDKKAKKGKTYYYKVRSVRKTGIKSKFTSPKKSGKVK